VIMSEVQPDFTLPALTLEEMTDLGRGLVVLDRVRAVLEQRLGCDPEHDPTVLAVRACRSALEIIYSEEVSPTNMRRVAQALHTEVALRAPAAGHG